MERRVAWLEKMIKRLLALDGHVTLPVWDDDKVVLSNIKAPASDPPTWVSYRGCEVPSFGAGGTNVLYFIHQLSHRYRLRSSINFHFHAVYPTAGTGNSVWVFTYSWANIDGTFPVQTTETKTFASPNTANYHALHAFTAIVGTGFTGSSCLLCSLSRKGGAAGDTFAGAIYGISADFHVNYDKLGAASLP